MKRYKEFIFEAIKKTIIIKNPGCKLEDEKYQKFMKLLSTSNNLFDKPFLRIQVKDIWAMKYFGIYFKNVDAVLKDSSSKEVKEFEYRNPVVIMYEDEKYFRKEEAYKSLNAFYKEFSGIYKKIINLKIIEEMVKEYSKTFKPVIKEFDVSKMIKEAPDYYKGFDDLGIKTLRDLAFAYFEGLFGNANIDQLLYDFLEYKGGVMFDKYEKVMKTFNEYLRQMKRNAYLKTADVGFDWKTVKELVSAGKLKTKNWIKNKAGKWIPIDKMDKDYEKALIPNDIFYIKSEKMAEKVLKARKETKA